MTQLEPQSLTRYPTQVLVVGGGDVAVAVGQLAQVLGWRCRITERCSVDEQFDGADAVIVLSHDVEIAGLALQTALGAEVRYVGAMGSRATQRRRHDWLVDHQMSPLQVAEIHGPAGLDIGAETPGEIALSITAEITAVLHHSPGGSISHREGAIHVDPAPFGVPRDCPGG